MDFPYPVGKDRNTSCPFMKELTASICGFYMRIAKPTSSFLNSFKIRFFPSRTISTES